jgi:chorismate-pyruvate lyase
MSGAEQSMSQLAEVPLRPLQIVATRADAAAEALLRRHFHAQDARPRSWQDVSLASLAPHHRTLMMTDGTVTRMLEAYTFESVEARCVEHRAGQRARWDWRCAAGRLRGVVPAVAFLRQDVRLLCARRYRVFVRKCPALVITERFLH